MTKQTAPRKSLNRICLAAILSSTALLGVASGDDPVPRDESLPRAEVRPSQVMVDVMVVQATRKQWETMAEKFGEPVGRTLIYEERDASIKDVEEAVQGNSKAKIIAHPRMVTVSGRRATLRAGGQLAATVPSGPGKTKDIVIELGLSITFDGKVLEDGKIQSAMRFRNRDLLTSDRVQINGVSVPSLKVVSFESAWTCAPGAGKLFVAPADREGEHDVTIVAVEVSRVEE